MAIKRLGQITLTLVVAALAVLGLAYFLGANSATAVAQTAAQPDPTQTERTLTVSGRGQVEAPPDMATVNLGVETEAETAVEALTQNSEQMQQVISATLDAGVAEVDIQTQGLSLNPVYDQTAVDGARELSGYRARNVVQITVREIDNLGVLLDDVVSAGGNTIEGIQFQVSNRAEFEEEARAAAMENARDKASQLAGLAGAELGQVLTLNETGFSSPTTFSADLAVAEAAAVPVQAGAQTIQYTINVTWQLQ